MAMLEVEDLVVRYSGLPVLQGVSVAVGEGQAVSVVGSNGAGKSTLLRAVMGTGRVTAGRIVFRGEDLSRLGTSQIVRRGLVYVPEDRKLFKPLTVEDNLKLGGYIVDQAAELARRLEYVYGMFPRLAERKRQQAGSLSGGEQQMLAIGRGLMAGPKLLMLDEPSLGLAPLMVSEVFETVRRLLEEGLTVLLVEQNVREALELTDYGYILQTGRIRQEGPAAELLESDLVREAFLGI
jgi:branched-chain amino acid transport system ATP-binding protein